MTQDGAATAERITGFTEEDIGRVITVRGKPALVAQHEDGLPVLVQRHQDGAITSISVDKTYPLEPETTTSGVSYAPTGGATYHRSRSGQLTEDPGAWERYDQQLQAARQ